MDHEARPIDWVDGLEEVQHAIDRYLENPDSFRRQRMHESRWRSVERIEAAGDGEKPAPDPFVLKHFHPRPDRFPFQSAMRRRFGLHSAQREWDALTHAHEAGLRVPRPLAFGVGERDGQPAKAQSRAWLATEYIAGRPLRQALEESSGSMRQQILCDLARRVDAFHEAGLRHGDLHLGNLLWTEYGVTCLDLGRARRSRSERRRLRDLAQLEFSLARAAIAPELARHFREAVGLEARHDTIRVALRRDFVRGRSRRQLRSGHDWQPIDRVGFSGIRRFDFAASEIDHFLDRRREPPSDIRRAGRVALFEDERKDGRRIILKHYRSRPGLPGLFGPFRPSPARRSFMAAERNRLLGRHSAQALAFLESSGSPFRRESWLILEAVGAEDLDRFRPDSPGNARAIAEAVGAWLGELHRAGLDHRDLKGSNIRIDDSPAEAKETRFTLIDLEDLRGPRRVGERARIRALCQLNASLDDDAFDDAARRAGLVAYATHAPLRRPLDVVCEEVRRKSLARRHRYRGTT